MCDYSRHIEPATEGLDIECSMQMDFDLRPPDKTALACAAFPGIPHIS